MRELRIGLKAPAVTRWQRFLQNLKPADYPQGFYTGVLDGVFSRELKRSTQQFQRWLLAQAAQSEAPGQQPEAQATQSVVSRSVGRKEFVYYGGKRKYLIQLHGRVDAATTLAAQELGFEPEPEFKMGPDVDVCGNLLESRPYFLIPMPEPPPAVWDAVPDKGAVPTDAVSDQRQERGEVRDRIRAWVRSVYPEQTNGDPRVTDIYIFSHGWHRNFYQAVSAYDRLSSRLACLMRSGRFDEDDGAPVASRAGAAPADSAPAKFKPSLNQNFRPLFLNLHWHSDPGEDDFVDKSGRRDKNSFLQKMAIVFEPKNKSDDAGIQMTKDFEDIFALFSRMAAPDTRPISDDQIHRESQQLFTLLDDYQLKDIPDVKSAADDSEPKIRAINQAKVVANRPTKTALAWTCYHEADTRQVLLDSDEEPEAFVTPWSAFVTFVSFVAGLLGVAFAGTLVGKLSKWMQWPPLSQWMQALSPFYALWVERLLAAGLMIFFLLLTGVSYRHGEVPGSKLDAGNPDDVPNTGREKAVRVFRWWRQLGAMVYFALLSVVTLAGIKAATLLPIKVWHQFTFWQKYHKAAPGLRDIHYYGLKIGSLLSYSLCLAGFISLLALVCWGMLMLLSRRLKNRPNASGRNPLSLPLLFWLPFQAAVALPVASYLLFTYFWGRATSGIDFIANLYPERIGKPDDLKATQRVSDYRDRLAIAARLPIQLIKNALTSDNSVIAPLDTVDGLLAFYEMQRKGVAAGQEAALFLCQLFLEAPELQGQAGKPHPKMRIHLVGHSFGALVVANMARYLALAKPQGSPSSLQTLCILEGAIASEWFAKEETLRRFVSGSIASIYSRYDTANGFYYPVSNNGRMAAGYVGLTDYAVPTAPDAGTLMSGNVEKREHFVLLVKPPELNAAQYFPDQKAPCPLPPLHTLNLDASRIIYQGAPASGGGHVDIYKDDVIHLVWAASRQ